MSDRGGFPETTRLDGCPVLSVCITLAKSTYGGVYILVCFTHFSSNHIFSNQ